MDVHMYVHMYMCTKGRHWRCPNFMNILRQDRNLSRHRRRPEKWCNEICAMKWQGSPLAVPKQLKLSRHRRCPKEWRSDMKWKHRNAYVFYDRTENWVATGGAQIDMMRWSQMKCVCMCVKGSPLAVPTEMMRWNKMKWKGRHWRCPILTNVYVHMYVILWQNRKLRRHRRCPDRNVALKSNERCMNVLM